MKWLERFILKFDPKGDIIIRNLRKIMDVVR